MMFMIRFLYFILYFKYYVRHKMPINGQNLQSSEDVFEGHRVLLRYLLANDDKDFDLG